MKLFALFMLFFGFGCSTVISTQPKGVLVLKQDMVEQEPIDALVSCMIPIYGKAKQPLITDGITVYVKNEIGFKALTRDGNTIWIRTIYPDGTKPSVGTVGSLIAHELTHITSMRKGEGGDPDHKSWEDGKLEQLEDASVVCMLDKLKKP